ncbi:MAG: ORF6N domain-containing protein [Bacilli bacterium]|nr:ORF6N domain-containing protein [Bacilli bacterium]
MYEHNNCDIKISVPKDFCFQLNSIEFKTLKSQNATSNIGRGGKQKLPFVYTEHGIIALVGVLKSESADKMSIYKK